MKTICCLIIIQYYNSTLKYCHTDEYIKQSTVYTVYIISISNCIYIHYQKLGYKLANL